MKRLSKNKAAFLDRDGVINRAIIRKGRAYSPILLKDFKFLPKVAPAVKALKAAGFKIILVTNQPDVGAGKQKLAVVKAMHRLVRSKLAPDDIEVCYHTQEQGCSCRKPKPGMLLQAAKKWRIDLKKSFMVGDRWRDVEAGKAAGCQTIWVKAGYKEKKAENPDAVVSSLYEASRWILSRRNKK